MNVRAIQQEVVAAEKAMNEYNAAFMAFKAECLRVDFEQMELEKGRALKALEEWFDANMMVLKLQQDA